MKLSEQCFSVSFKCQEFELFLMWNLFNTHKTCWELSSDTQHLSCASTMQRHHLLIIGGISDTFMIWKNYINSLHGLCVLKFREGLKNIDSRRTSAANNKQREWASTNSQCHRKFHINCSHRAELAPFLSYSTTPRVQGARAQLSHSLISFKFFSLSLDHQHSASEPIHLFSWL